MRKLAIFILLVLVIMFAGIFIFSPAKHSIEMMILLGAIGIIVAILSEKQ